MAPGDFAKKWYEYYGCRTKEIIRETEIIDEKPKGEPYRKMRLVKIDPRSELIREKKEPYVSYPSKWCEDCRNFYEYSAEYAQKCPKCGSTNVKGEVGNGRPKRWTHITRERELSEIAAFVETHHRFITSLKEMNDTASEKDE